MWAWAYDILTGPPYGLIYKDLQIYYSQHPAEDLAL